jgi:hypothetical protein
MKTKLSQTKSLLLKREEKLEMMGECYVIFRHNDFPLLLKPIKVRSRTSCALTKKTIYEGDYAYPCHENPIRLTPNGTSKVRILEALQAGDKILPKGYFPVKLPTTENLIDEDKIKKLRIQQSKYLERHATKLLREAAN